MKLPGRTSLAALTATALLAAVLASACGGASQRHRIASATPTAGAAPPVPPLTAVRFVDEQHGWLGGRGIILATADGGRSWQSGYTGPLTILGFDFADLKHGWALAARGWSPVNPPGSKTVLDTLLGTTDGGRSWVTVSELPYPISSLNFVSATTGFAIAYRLPSGPLTLVRTIDGGKNRQAVSTPEQPVATCFFDRQHGWVAALHPERQGAPFPGLAVLRSDDGGHAWTTSFTVPWQDLQSGGGPVGPFPVSAQLACRSDTTVWFLAHGAPEHFGVRAYHLYRTLDAGRRWRQVASSVAIPPGPGQTGPVGAPLALDAVDGQNAYLLTVCPPCGAPLPRVSLARTDNGGASWRNLTPPVTSSAVAQVSLSFLAAERGWAVVQETISEEPPRLFETRNDGRTWVQRSP